MATLDILSVEREWNESFLEKGISSLSSELTLAQGTPGGQESYRQTLALGFFFKLFVMVTDQRRKSGCEQVQ